MTIIKNKSNLFKTLGLVLILTSLIIFIFIKLIIPVMNDEKNTSETNFGKVTNLSVLSYGQNDKYNSYLSSLFNKKSPNIISYVNNYPVEYFYDVAKVSITTDNGADIIMIENPAVIDNLIPSTQLTEIVDLLDLDWRGNINIYSQKNSQYITPPLGIDTYTLYYNADYISDISEKIFEPTVEEIYNICSKMEEHGINGIALGTRSITSIKNMLVQLSYDDINQSNFDTAKNNFAILSEFIPQNAFLYDCDDARDQFIKGDSCFYFGMESEMDYICRKSEFTIGNTFLSLNNHCIAWYDYYGMFALSNSSSNKIEALNMLKDISNDDARKIFIEFKDQNITKCEISAYDSIQPTCNWFYEDEGNILNEYMSELSGIQQALF